MNGKRSDCNDSKRPEPRKPREKRAPRGDTRGSEVVHNDGLDRTGSGRRRVDGEVFTR